MSDLRAALDEFYEDNHRWSVRPCATCAAITNATGIPFGCDKMAGRKALAAASGAARQADLREQFIEKVLSLIEVVRYEIKDKRHESGRPHVTICGFSLKGRNSRTLAHAERRAQRLKDSIRAALASSEQPKESGVFMSASEAHKIWPAAETPAAPASATKP